MTDIDFNINLSIEEGFYCLYNQERERERERERDSHLYIFEGLYDLAAFFGIRTLHAESENLALGEVIRKQLGLCDRHVVDRTPLVGFPDNDRQTDN